MGDRDIFHSPTPDELLDSWLDALNEPRGVPPEPPEGIADVAGTALRYDHALAMRRGSGPAVAAHSERNGSMSPQTLLDTVPVAIPRRYPTRSARAQPARTAWLSGAFSTAVMVVLVMALAGGGFIYQMAMNGGGERTPGRMALMASGTATPQTGSLACGSPGYVPIVEGEMNEETLASIGIDETPLHVDGDSLHIPTSSGEVVDLPSSWTPVLDSPLWADSSVPRSETSSPRGETTVRNIETGQEWTFPVQPWTFPGAYQAPYLIVPRYAAANDWRIINTITGEERFVSEIRGDDFPVRVEISQIGGRTSWYGETPETTVWAFDAWPPDDSFTGPNVLVLPQSLDEATFLDVPAAGMYAQDRASSESTGRIAYATDGDEARQIVVFEPETGEQFVIDDERFGTDTLPLMFSDDGQTLIVDQSEALFSIAIDGEPAVSTLLNSERLVPVAYNAASMSVLVMFEDGGLAMVDARSGEVKAVPDVEIEDPLVVDGNRLFRMPYETDVYEILDERAGTVRLVSLLTGTVSDPLQVFIPDANRIVPPIQPDFQMEIRYPHTQWREAFGYLDETLLFRAVSTETLRETWLIPAPAGIAVGESQVVDLRVTPNGQCIVMNVIESVGEEDYSGKRPPGRVTSWIAPMEPGASWTKLDISITGWWKMPEQSDRLVLPAPDVATPVASPVSS